MAAGLDDRGVDVSLMQSPVSSDVERYADTYTIGPSAAVSALPSQTQKVTPFPGMAGGVKEVRLLEALMWAMGARRVLEIGTFTGAPAVALAEALPSHGAGITIDADETVASVARRQFDVSPHGTKIELHLGDARRDCENPRRPVRSRAWRASWPTTCRGSGLPFNRSATDAETDRVRAFVEHCGPTPNAPRPSHRGSRAPADLGAGAVDS